jgi:hypothetical protein
MEILLGSPDSWAIRTIPPPHSSDDEGTLVYPKLANWFNLAWIWY